MTRFPVEGIHVQMFDRAVGRRQLAGQDPDYDHTAGVSATAAPTFLQAVAQFADGFRATPEVRSSAADEPVLGEAAEPARELAAEQHFEFFRRVRVGDVLEATFRTGNAWQRQSRTGAPLAFEERIVDYKDESGSLVATAIAVVVQVGIASGAGHE